METSILRAATLDEYFKLFIKGFSLWAGAIVLVHVPWTKIRWWSRAAARE
jgi:hypothetical protein